MAYKFIIAVKKDQVHEKHPIGRLKLGMVSYHRDLRSDDEYVYGGGEFNINNKNKTVEFYEESADFGLPRFDNIDWKYIEWEEEFKDYKITYTFPAYYPVEERVIDVKPLINFCL